MDAVTLAPNSTSVIPTTATTVSRCQGECRYTPPQMLTLEWVSFKPTKTITAATVRIIVNTDLNTTRTTTILNEIPEGYELPPTNSAGARITDWIGDDELTTTMLVA